ncbi:MAG: AAA family ATPase [Xanthomonadales bacterium]|jgi:aminoglycoside phosphotransferase family enzyme/predicted kinase|nr:AAA family ATPase [Xanthomonadales bacterium]
MNKATRKDHYPELIRGLLGPAAYPHEVREIRVVETHISWVILTGDFAYKVKKPVALGFLDFSTLEARRHFCEEELRVNRRTAADLYLDVVPIGSGPDGFRIGAEPAIEFAVRMRQFPHAARLDRCLQAGLLGLPEMRALASTIARFHQGLAPRREIDAAYEVERVVKPARNNFMHLDPAAFDDESQQRLAVIEAWTLQQSEALAPAFEERARNGAIRECHGDLHLENLLLQDDRFVPFDALEFNPNLRWIDVANDIAFLVMDLMARGRADFAYTVLSSWLEESGDYDSLGVMRFYLVYRSMVRAVVTAIRQRQGGSQPDDSARPGAASYIKLAAELVDTPPAQLFLMHGFSGSGKTWRSARLIADLPVLRVRSDLERKRLPGLAAGQKSIGEIGSGLYEADVTDRTYRALARHCETGLRAGFDMIADATFLRRRHRSWFAELAASLGAKLSIMDCKAPVEVLRSRIRARSAERQDASDADIAVLEYQLDHHDPFDEAERALVVELEDSNSG